MASSRKPAHVGVLDGRDIPALNTILRARGVSDSDRHEVLKAVAAFEAQVDLKSGKEKAGHDGQ